jgi:hypothetical protein
LVPGNVRPDIDRRTALERLGVTAAASLAGCLGSAGGPPTDSPETPKTDSPTRTPDPDTPSETPSTTPSRTPTPTPSDPDATFAVMEAPCGSGENAATVTFAGDAVEISGTIRGGDTCDTATLDSVEFSEDTLVVRVRTDRKETTGTMACGQCLTDIRYVATVRFDGGLPDEVRVVHETGGQTVTVARANR